MYNVLPIETGKTRIALDIRHITPIQRSRPSNCPLLFYVHTSSITQMRRQ